jgi:hypothetical protein
MRPIRNKQNREFKLRVIRQTANGRQRKKLRYQAIKSKWTCCFKTEIHNYSFDTRKKKWNENVQRKFCPESSNLPFAVPGNVKLKLHNNNNFKNQPIQTFEMNDNKFQILSNGNLLLQFFQSGGLWRMQCPQCLVILIHNPPDSWSWYSWEDVCFVACTTWKRKRLILKKDGCTGVQWTRCLSTIWNMNKSVLSDKTRTASVLIRWLKNTTHLLNIHWWSSFKNKRCLSRENQS